MKTVLKAIQKWVLLVVAVVACSGCTNTYLPSLSASPWQVVHLPVEVTPLDVAFTSDPKHGWISANQSTLLETTDGGMSWEVRPLDFGGQLYNFTSVSFSGNEGWVVGQPNILLHTNDGGTSWEEVALSDKLPGSPYTIVALGPQSAEMTTDVGAIYQTSDSGMTWKAMVQEAIGVLRNIARSPDGSYVSVSARGNFYSVWSPGMESWEPHNRNSSRRLQNMGFTHDGRLWLLARGGIVQFSESLDNQEEWEDAVSPEFATSWGLLDLAYRTDDEIWVAGGSGNLLRSVDGGKTWEKDRSVESTPSNFYRIVFIGEDAGFVLGQRGVILRYQGLDETV
jgi:photosystem II stability/assembly factor-like uncharacterized protein